MRATATLKELTCDSDKHTIVRNLNRILDIRILDIDTESRTISFLYNSVLALKKVKRELFSIGFPVMQCRCQDQKKLERDIANNEGLSVH